MHAYEDISSLIQALSAQTEPVICIDIAVEIGPLIRGRFRRRCASMCQVRDIACDIVEEQQTDRYSMWIALRGAPSGVQEILQWIETELT